MSSYLISLCVCFSFIGSTIAYYNDDSNSLLTKAMTDIEEGPKLHRRQSPPEEGICEEVLTLELCTNGYYEDYAYLAVQCGYTRDAMVFREVCSMNSAGDMCGSLDIGRERFNNTCDDSSTTCSTECKDFLTTTRDRLGCCVSAFNSSEIEDEYELQTYGDPFSYSLWSMCGVETISEQCEATFDLPTIGVDPECTEREFFNRISFRVICKSQFLESTASGLRAAGCQDEFIDDSTCSVNEHGQYCGQFDIDFSAPQTNCFDTSVCDPLCLRTLVNLTNTLGCCFNVHYNHTNNYNEWASYEFWQLCGLKSPGLCEMRFDTSNTRISDSGNINSSALQVQTTKTVFFLLALFVIAFISIPKH